MARLLDKYKEQIIPEMVKKFSFGNILEVPKLIKIVINMGIGKSKDNKKVLESALKHLTVLSGQKPIVTKARKAVAGFKTRRGDSIGCKVTLRGKRAYEFLDRLISVVLPRIKDFRGLTTASFDGRGNYSLGLTELAVFPDVDIDNIEFEQGMDITIVMTGNSNEHSSETLRLFGMPFKS